MPIFVYDFLPGSRSPAYDEETLEVVLAGLGLRPVDGETGYRSVFGNYPAVSGWVTFPNRRMNGFVEFIGMREFTAMNHANSSVAFQVSRDGGTTWCWHDGDEWVEASDPTGPEEANSIDQVNDHLAGFRLGHTVGAENFKDFRFRLALINGDQTGKSTPVLYQIELAVELKYAYDDDLQRSLKRYLAGHLIPRTLRRTMPADAQAVEFYTELSVDANSIIIYDLTNDPTRETDLFDDIDALDSSDHGPHRLTANLTAEVEKDALLEISFYGTAPVTIHSRDADMFEANKPGIIAIIGRQEIDADAGNPGMEVGTTPGLSIRKRGGETHYLSDMSVFCLASNPMELAAMEQAIQRRLFQQEFLSIGSGEPYRVVSFGAISANNSAREERIGGTFTAKISGKYWDEEYRTVPAATSFVAAITDIQNRL
jgi:hypothetical protein